MKDMFAQGGSGSVGIKTNKQAIARQFGVKPNEVVYFSVGTVLSGYKVIYDKERQRAYPLPVDLPVDTTAISLTVAAVLTHSGGTVDLGNLAATRGDYVTLPGSFDTGLTVNTHNELVTFTDGSYRWAGVLPKTVPQGATPANSGGISDTAWVRVGAKYLLGQLPSLNGASIVGTHSGKTVQQVLDTISGQAVVYAEDYPNLLDACEALRQYNGGVVKLPYGRIFAGQTNGSSSYMSVPNVTIIGYKMPTWNDDASELIGGSVVEGKFNVFAHNFTIMNVGFDVGLNVVNRRWPGSSTTEDYPYGGTWDGFAFGQPSQSTPLAARRNVTVVNVVGLLKDSATVGHGILLEAINGGFVDNVTGIYGVHGVVFKSEHIQAGSVNGYMASVDNVIIKSDSYAFGGNIQIANVRAERHLPNCTPHSTPSVACFGIYFNPETANFTGPIQLGNATICDAQFGIAGANASNNVGPDIQISNLDVDGSASNVYWAVFFTNLGTFPRFFIGNANIKNVGNGVFLRYTNQSDSLNCQSSIGNLKLTNITNNGIMTADYGRTSFGSVEMFNVGTGYFYHGQGRLSIGAERLVAVTARSNAEPAFAVGWTNFGNNNSTMSVAVNGHRVHMKGLVTAGSGAGGIMFALPERLRPKEDLRFTGYLNTAGTSSACLIGVSRAGWVTINDAVAPATGSFVSLDGISWDIPM